MTYALAIPSITALDSLDRYVQQIKTFPVLSAEEELNLATRLRKNNDLEAAKQLVVSHLRLVVSIARGYSGYGLPQADLVQEGNIGLMKAVKRFDPERGVRLVSFAMHWIKAEIHEYIVKNWRLVKIATTKAQRKLFFNLRSMRQGIGTLQNEEIDSIAKALKVKPEEVVDMESRLNGHEIPLESSADDENDEAFSPISYLQDTRAQPMEALVDQEKEHLHTVGLSQAIASLDERSQKIVQARWLNEGEEATLHDLAAEFGVSAERIRQIEQKAMQKLKALLTE